MTRSVSGGEVRADHPAAPTWVPRPGEGGSALAGESPDRAVGQDRAMPPTTSPRGRGDLVARIRALLAEARGTAGRLTRDSALVQQLRRVERELGGVMSDFKRDPARFIAF